MTTRPPTAWQRLAPRTRLLFISLGALLTDAATKAGGVALLERSSLGPGWAQLTVVRNPGFALGIGASLSGGTVLAVTVVVVAVVAAALWRGGLREPVAAGLVLGGAIANVADRAIDGTVVDLIHVGPWPTFNLADAFIVIGLGLLLVRGPREERTASGSLGSGKPGVSKEP